jgi:hypothetical protein
MIIKVVLPIVDVIAREKVNLLIVEETQGRKPLDDGIARPVLFFTQVYGVLFSVGLLSNVKNRSGGLNYTNQSVARTCEAQE